MIALAALAVACGDDSGAGLGEGCTTDVECKGDRICVDQECVDPAPSGDGDGDRDPDAGDGDGDSGAGGQGGGGASGASGSAGDEPIDDPELEAACILNCEARDAASCEMNIGSVDQCTGQCLVADENSRGYCLDEQAAQYACLASGGYACVSGYPQQQATCIAESTALSECLQLTPCRSFCDSAASECAGVSDDCVADCREKEQSFSDTTICSIYYDQLLACWALNPECDGERPSVANCGGQVAEVADCIGSRLETCDGFCWAAEALGCGSTECVTDCQAKVDDSACGSYYRNLIDCSIDSFELSLTCEGGEPTPDAVQCASYIEQYDTCMTQ